DYYCQSFDNSGYWVF
nr:immunoglobulin light chain junction region [Macaca mulatta]MOW56944.1 immunoglobulin light chain junction region [Macaca mulatta]MOW57068.1 immunoglobulin light chain junction region [Macaca mulatta]MOW57501.1 immunoglobulin light chain junction region [Macaca mulatta]MOW59318.1 immunoglobulin light chain junction region [Macaca mulatta]